MKATQTISALLLLSASLLAQSAAPGPQTTPKTQETGTAAAMPSATVELANEVLKLRERMEAQDQRMEAQDQRIRLLEQEVRSRDQQIVDLQIAASRMSVNAYVATSSSFQNVQAVGALQGTDGDIKLDTANVAASMQEQQQPASETVGSPLAIHYKGVTLSPGGFVGSESVWRQHATGSDVNTPFNSIPFPGNDAAHLTEFFGSARQSRITLLSEGKIKDAKLSGYFEADWLSVGISSNNNQSNSYTNRERQLWGQVAFSSGWTFTGGQMWSLVTETEKGLDNRTEAVPLTIDAQYHVGFSWTRQYSFRVTKSFNNKIWLGFAVENPQTTNLGGGGFNNNFVVGAPGTDGYNGGVNVLGAGSLSAAANYSFNYTPDFVAKAAFEPGVGHYEVFGLIRSFRDRIYPAAALTNPPTPQCGVAVPTATTPPCNEVRMAGGIGANARWSLAQEHVVVGIHFLGGDGVGRYGSAALPDVTARPNGTLAPIRGYQALGTLEWHSPHWDFYANAGGEYAERTIYLSPTGAQMGYGRTTQSTANCLVEPNPAATSNGTKAGFSPASNTCPDTRNLLEGTFGFWYRFYHGPKGSVELGPQYSYLVLNTWRNATGGPHAVENMFFSSFRYYLP